MAAQLVRLALRRRTVTLVLALAMAGLGLWAGKQLKVEAYPDISDTGVVIITVVPGLAAEEVEQQVTVPIERALNNVPRVIARRSRTIFGLSVVELTFDDGTDDYFARQVVLEKLRDADLPDGVTPTLGPLTSGISEFYRYVLEAPGYTPVQVRELQDWVITPRLLQVPGVADVTTFGGLVKQYQIELNPMALEKFKLGVRQVASAVKDNNRNAGGALLEGSQQSMAIRGVGLIQSVADIENIVVDAQKGVPVFVRDLGRVRIGFAPPTGILGIDDASGLVEGIVLMRRWENLSEVLQSIHQAVEEINATRLPRGVRIVPIHDRTELVNNTFHTVARTLAEGLVIVTTVLLLFLVQIRAALLTALTIPLSLLFAFAAMYYVGVPASLLSLGALDFGIIVDGTLIMVEHILRRLPRREEHPSEAAVWRAVAAAGTEVARPIFFSLVIIVCAFIPLLTLERVEKRLFTPMAMTVCFALLGSLLLTLTVVPVLATYLFRRGVPARRNYLERWCRSGYERLLRVAMRWPATAVALTGTAVLLSFPVAARLGTEFLPQLDEGVIWIRSGLPAGISLTKSAEVASSIRHLIRQSPEVKLVASQTGRNDSGTDPFGANRNEFLVDLRPYGEWTATKSKGQLVEELSARLRAAVPGASFNFTQPIIDTSTEIATGSSADLAVILVGPDLRELRRLAGQTLALLQGVQGAADASIEQEGEQAQLRIRMNRQTLARYGINIADVQDVVELALGGRPVSAVFEGERKFDIAARFAPEARGDATTIGQILIATRDGGRVPLSQLADVQITDGATIIARRENQRQITVRTNIRGRDQGGFVAEAQALFAQRVALPPGYQVVWGGQFENLQRARQRLSIIIPITIAIIFALLFVTFGSARDAGLVLMCVPFSLVGGIVALSLRAIHLSVSAAVGFISLFGVAIMAGVLIVTEIRRLRAEGDGSLREDVVQGALTQMLPVLMMVLVAMLGMMPAALARGIGSDIQRPLATVLVGGLASTLCLTLVAMPPLYFLLERRRDARAGGRNPDGGGNGQAG